MRLSLKTMYEELRIIHYPDPRLRKVSQPVTEITPQLRELAMRMLELMRQSKGVGLAAPQVGHNIRLFVMNPDGAPGNDRIYFNPVLSDPNDEETAEEGCLSLPDIHVQVLRHKAIHMHALDIDGKPIEDTQSGFVARVWQHEFDHLNGVLITDRMGLGDRFQHRRVLKEMEEKYAAEHPELKSKPKSTALKQRVRKKRD